MKLNEFLCTYWEQESDSDRLKVVCNNAIYFPNKVLENYINGELLDYATNWLDLCRYFEFNIENVRDYVELRNKLSRRFCKRLLNLQKDIYFNINYTIDYLKEVCISEYDNLFISKYSNIFYYAFYKELKIVSPEKMIGSIPCFDFWKTAKDGDSYFIFWEKRKDIKGRKLL